MAILAEKMDIRVCFAYRVSEVGLKKFMENGVEVHYEERIPLVKSSKNPSKVCPIEDFLSKHNDTAEQWKFLEERQKGTAYREGDVSL